ncbi:MAG: KH domain-containing protein [Candidatus Spechtbacteria bacterium SB0662_bin_43]|uniref:RNA-binding protein KhpA n=1 Tax=Candidatus Spechtbacteria bacterium SB0662_bin_43 TaxID=2604897 RepID=A0A845D9L4_9BACT|nr:KH domain-containing protein [Candidatus Spechtbacteria bacterium SB0662_bin_43]
MTDDKEFLEYIIKGIVNNPDDVMVERKVDELGVLLTLKVNPEDMGQVIGKGGATARAVRTLLRIVGMKSNARVNLKIEEPEGSARRTSQDAMQDNASNESPEASQPQEQDSKVDINEAIGDLD